MKNSYYDVVIVGAGTGGIAAANAFIGTTYKVAVVDKLKKLGGTSTNAGVCTWIEGINLDYQKMIYDKLFQSGYATGDFENSWLPAKFSANHKGSSLDYNPEKLSEEYMSILKNHKNIDLYLGHRFVVIENMANKHVDTILIQDMESSEQQLLSGQFFIDCSGDGLLCKNAADNIMNGYNKGFNTLYYLGRDQRSKYNESLAQVNQDIKQLNEPSLFFKLSLEKSDFHILNKINTVYAYYIENNKEIKISDEIFFDDNKFNNYSLLSKKIYIKKPPYINQDGYRFNLPKKEYYCNPMTGTGMTGYDYMSMNYNQFIKTINQRTYEYWKFIKYSLLLAKRHKEKGFWNHSGWQVDECKFNILELTMPLVGIRETYRVQCDYMLNQNDLIKDISKICNNNDFKRFIAIGSHNVDMHNQTGLVGITAFNHQHLRPYGIPFDCLVPNYLNNVLIGCKAFGASQIAVSSARVMKTVSQLGYAAGMAIRLCLDYKKDNVRLDTDYIRILQSEKYTNFKKYFQILMSKL